MKRILTVVLTIFLMLTMSVGVSAVNGEIDTYNDTPDYKEMVSGISYEARELLEEIGITEISYEVIFEVSPKKVFDSFLNLLSRSAGEPMRYFLYSLGILALIALIEDISGNKEIISMAGTATLLALLSVQVISLTARAFSVLESLSAFNVSFAGVFCGMLSASGGVVGSSAYLGMNVFANSFLSTFFSLFSEPLVSFFCAFAFLSCFNNEMFSVRLCELLKKVYVWALGFATTLFSGVSAIKSVLSNSADTVTVKGIKFLVGKSLPIVGGVVSESYQSIIASLGLIKNTVGVFGIVTVVVIVLPVMLELIMWCVSFSLTGALAELFGCVRVSTVASLLKDSCVLLVATVAFTGMLFIVTTGLMIVLRGG